MDSKATSRFVGSTLCGVLAGVALTAGFPATGRAEQFVLIDETFTFTKAEADANNSHYYGSKLNPERPSDWTQPVDYVNGSVHVRLEVLDKPAGGEITQWVLCYIAQTPIDAGYGCTGTGTYTEEGVYDVDNGMDFWQHEDIDWTDGVKEMHLVMKDSDDSTGFAHLRPDVEEFFPTTVRITMVQVSAGSTYDPSLVPGIGEMPEDAGVGVPPPHEPVLDGGAGSGGSTDDDNTMGNTMGTEDMNGSGGNGSTGGANGETHDEPTPETATEDASGCSVGTMGTTASTHVGAMALGLSALIARARPRKRNQSA